MNPTASLTLLSDEPIHELERDRLDLASWAQVIASAALGTEGPFTIGVFGQWGVGKTSVLQLAKRLIEQSNQALDRKAITTVFFNAWKYEAESHPLVPLIASIVQALEEEGGGRRVRKASEGLRSALRAALYGISAKIKGQIPMIGEAELALSAEKAAQRFESLRSHWIDQQIDQSLYFNAFKALRETQRGGADEERHRVVVFIDDLDRCFPDQAVRLLERIKLVLNEPGFIFVLAVDRRVVDSYLDKRFREEYGLDEPDRGQSYLAKFIQLPLWIPPHETRFTTFIERVLEEPALDDSRAELAPIAREIGLACGHNPRQLTRYLNDLLVDRFLFRYTAPKKRFPFRLFAVARGVRLHSELVYYGLLNLQKLCDTVRGCGDLEALRRLIAAEIARASPTDPEFNILPRIQGNEDLAALLISDPGKEWLKNKQRRYSVENFLASEREAAGEWESWVQRRTEIALEQINSDDPTSIMAGCYWLSEYDSPLRSQAIPRLRDLAEGEDQRIAREARRVLANVPAKSTTAARS